MELPKSLREGKITNIHDCKTIWFERVVKAPLRKVLTTLLQQYPEPINLPTQNARVWLEIKEKFLKCERMPGVGKLADLMFNMIIAEYVHDPVYEQRVDWVVNELFKAISEGRYILRDPLPECSWDNEGYK